MHLYNCLEMHRHITPQLKGKMSHYSKLSLCLSELLPEISNIYEKQCLIFFLQMFHGHAVKLLISVAHIDPLRFTPQSLNLDPVDRPHFQLFGMRISVLLQSLSIIMVTTLTQVVCAQQTSESDARGLRMLSVSPKFFLFFQVMLCRWYKDHQRSFEKRQNPVISKRNNLWMKGLFEIQNLWGQ